MKKTITSVIAVCLAAVLLCGAACFGTAVYVHRQTDAAKAAASGETTVTAPVSVSSVGYSNTAKTAAADTMSATEIYELACKQVVGISTEITGTNMFGQTISTPVSGTGFVISEDGYILTNNHVVEDAVSGGYKVTVMFYDGTEYTATIIGTEGDTSDVAVLKINATGLTPVTLGDSGSMKVGENAYVVGNPLGELTYTMTSGIVSALDREITVESNTKISMFQLDAAINEGNSGGPVYNDRGQVIGIVTAKYKSTGVEGLGFAIPINEAQDIASELMAHGYVTGKAFLGITVTDITESEAYRYNLPAGVYVYSVTPGSCADKAGMKQGDVIVALGGTEVTSTSDLATAKKNYKAGDTCIVTVSRSGEEIDLTVVFDEQKPETEETETTVPDDRDSYTDVVPVPTPSEAPETVPVPGDRDDTDTDSSEFDDWMSEFFDRFSEYFGSFGSQPEDEQPSDSETEGGFRHFG